MSIVQTEEHKDKVAAAEMCSTWEFGNGACNNCVVACSTGSRICSFNGTCI